MTRLVVVGASGHARVVAAVLSVIPEFSVVGVLDRTVDSVGESVGQAQVIGTWDDLARFRQDGVEAAALAIGNNSARAAMSDRVHSLGYVLPASREEDYARTRFE